MSEKALTAVVQEAYVQGISTRKVDDLVQSMSMTGISKSSVSGLCAETDERVDAFLNLSLAGDWPDVWLDATYIKSREHGPVASQAVVVATAVNPEGSTERCWACRSARRKPRRSGRTSCVRWWHEG